MKISKNTLNILNSFVNLNPSILIREGNILSTTNGKFEQGKKVIIKSILAVAEIEEEFDREIGIFNLKQFLQVISSFDDPELIFNDTYVTISEGSNKIKYAYCDPEHIIYPNTNSLPISNVLAEFIIESKIFNKLNKLSNILKNEDLVIKSVNNEIEILLTNDNDSSNEYCINIEKECDEFEFKTNVKDLIVMEDDYKAQVVDVKGRNVLYLEGLNNNLKYYITKKA